MTEASSKVIIEEENLVASFNPIEYNINFNQTLKELETYTQYEFQEFISNIIIKIETAIEQEEIFGVYKNNTDLRRNLNSE
jgi:hypothetical protein